MKNNDIIIDSKLFKQNNKNYIIVFASYLLHCRTMIRTCYLYFSVSTKTGPVPARLCQVQGLFKDYQAVNQH